MNQIVIGVIILIIVILFIICRKKQKEPFTAIDSAKLNSSTQDSEKCNLYCQDG